MGFVLCPAASFCWYNCPASFRFHGGSVCLGDMAALEVERLRYSVNSNGQSDSSFRVNESQPYGQSRQTAQMWQKQPDYARYKEKLNGEGWLVNKKEGMLLQIKPDTPT